MYYRRSVSTNPMSDWGHAMFAENQDSILSYGENEFTYNGEHGVELSSLHDIIVSEWEKAQENFMCPVGFDDIEAEEIYSEFNPEDIVMSAGAWDCAELIAWFCDNIAIPNDIQAVITCDGAIVFDSSLIQCV